MSAPPPLSEVELKADVDHSAADVLFARVVGLPRVLTLPAEECTRDIFTDLYFDTDDLRLFGANGYVRLRDDGNNPRVTFRQSASGSFQQRVVEVTRPATELARLAATLIEQLPDLRAPDTAAGTPDLALESMGLSPVLRLHTDRVEVRLGGSPSPIRVKLDTTVYDQDNVAYYQVEVDFYSPDRAAEASQVFNYLTALARGHMRFTSVTKLERGLGLKRLRRFRLS